MIEIKWLGHACFASTYKGYTILIDPYNSDYTAGYPKLRVKADAFVATERGKRRGLRKMAGESDHFAWQTGGCAPSLRLVVDRG